MQKVFIFRLHRYEYIENKYKDTNVIDHKLQCSQTPVFTDRLPEAQT